MLFISGTAGDLRRPNTALTSPLPEHFEVLAYDQRGMGQSDKPDQPYSMQDYAEDAVAILDAYGWDKVLLVGYSFGGMVAQEVAIRWPDRVKRMVLIGTAAGGKGGSSFPLETLIELSPKERARRGLEVMDLRFTKEWQRENPEATEQILSDNVKTQAEFEHEPGAIMGAHRQLAARAKHDTYDRLHHITAPTLVLSGRQDGQAPMPAQKAMAEAIPGAQFEVMEGSHAMLWESPSVFDRVIAFLQA